MLKKDQRIYVKDYLSKLCFYLKQTNRQEKFETTELEVKFFVAEAYFNIKDEGT